MAAASVATAGWVMANTMTTSQGTSAAYLSADYLGALFQMGQDGSNASGHNAIVALRNHKGDGTAKTFSYTFSTGADTAAVYLAFRFLQLPDPSLW
jgi:hypothetical protein